MQANAMLHLLAIRFIKDEIFYLSFLKKMCPYGYNLRTGNGTQDRLKWSIDIKLA